MSFLRFMDTMELVWKQLEKAGVFLQRLLLFCFLPAFFSLGFATVLCLLHTTHLPPCDSGHCVSWSKCVRLSFLFPSPLSHCVLTRSLMTLFVSFCSFPKAIPGEAQYREQLWTLEAEVLALSLSCSVDLSGQLHFLGFKTVKYEETNVHFLGTL